MIRIFNLLKDFVCYFMRKNIWCNCVVAKIRSRYTLTKCEGLATCRSDKNTTNNRRKYFSLRNNHNGHLNDLGLSFYIHHKYFL